MRQLLPEPTTLVDSGSYHYLHNNYGLRHYQTFKANTFGLEEKFNAALPTTASLLLDRLRSILEWEGFWYCYGFPFDPQTEFPTVSVNGYMSIYAISTEQDGDFCPHYVRQVGHKDERLPSDEISRLLDRSAQPLHWEIWSVYGIDDLFRAHAPLVGLGNSQIEGTLREVCEGMLLWDDYYAHYIDPTP